YDVLSYFPTLYDNYEKITATPGNSHVQICNYVKRHFDRGNDDTHFFSTCQKIAIFIKYLQGNDLSSDINRSCKYLNYLINFEVQKFYYTPYQTPDFYKNIIQEYENEGYTLKTVCKGVIEHIDNAILLKIRKLYNLYYAIHKFINTSASTRECKTLGDYVQLHRAYRENCVEESQDAFCKALKQFSHYCYAHNSILIDCPKERSSLLSYTLKENTVGDVVDGDEEAPVEGPKENDHSRPSTQHHMGADVEFGLLRDRSPGSAEDIVDALPDNPSGYNGSSNGTIISTSLINDRSSNSKNQENVEESCSNK
ncbi:hypothetical protein PVIIG_05786, partial [Plasmodium vivax India VII]